MNVLVVMDVQGGWVHTLAHVQVVALGEVVLRVLAVKGFQEAVLLEVRIVQPNVGCQIRVHGVQVDIQPNQVGVVILYGVIGVPHLMRFHHVQHLLLVKLK